MSNIFRALRLFALVWTAVVIAVLPSQLSSSATLETTINLPTGSRPTVLAVSHAGDKISCGVVGSEGFSLSCYDAINGQLIWQAILAEDSQGNPIPPNGLLFRYDDSYVAAIERFTGVLKLYDSESGTLIYEYQMTGKPVSVSEVVVSSHNIIVVITHEESSAYYFSEDPFEFITKVDIPGEIPGEPSFDIATQNLLIPVADTDLLVAHSLTWNNGLSVQPSQANTGDGPLICPLVPLNGLCAVICSADGTVRLHDTASLEELSSHSGLTNVADAFCGDKLVILSHHVPGHDGYFGRILLLDTTTWQGTQGDLQDRLPVSLVKACIPGVVYAVDRGVHCGEGTIGPGALLAIDEQTALIVESIPLAGRNVFAVAHSASNRLFVSEPAENQIEVYAIP